MFFFVDEHSMYRYVREDGIIEDLGALGLLLASIGFGVAYRRSSSARRVAAGMAKAVKRNVFYLLLCLFFAVAFMEEISWGQRIFHVQTPEALKQLNRQGETNLHNLVWFHGHDRSGNRKPFLQLFLNGDRLFSFFWFAYCVFIPLSAKYSRWARNVFTRIRLPIVPLRYAFLFFGSYVVSKGFERINPECEHGIVETKESLAGLLFMCVAWGQVRMLSKGPDVSEDVSESTLDAHELNEALPTS
jgi:hypothetical protein